MSSDKAFCITCPAVDFPLVVGPNILEEIHTYIRFKNRLEIVGKGTVNILGWLGGHQNVHSQFYTPEKIPQFRFGSRIIKRDTHTPINLRFLLEKQNTKNIPTFT